MRKVIYIALLAVISFGCEPQIQYFNVQPSVAGAGPANVTLHWKITVGTGEMAADQKVWPSLNPAQKVNNQGSRVEQICKTTTFKLSLPYGGEQSRTVTVSQPCKCGNHLLTFTGSCISSLQGPAYNTQTAQGNPVEGNLANLTSDADFPIHVVHNNIDIPLAAGGGPLGPIPPTSAAGDYTIYVPGQAGLNVCAGAGGPNGGGTIDAPVVHVTIVPACVP